MCPGKGKASRAAGSRHRALVACARVLRSSGIAGGRTRGSKKGGRVSERRGEAKKKGQKARRRSLKARKERTKSAK
eukprot:113562-Pleurochrysis_carterae.AAC.1